jgi:hydrogenase-4 component B
MMRSSMIVLAFVCVLIGIAPLLLQPVLSRVVSCWSPDLPGTGLTQPLAVVGAANMAFLIIALIISTALWRRVRHGDLKHTVTWDCGYATPTPRMQYTAGSFAGIITEWFGWILRPEQNVRQPEGYFPNQARWESHTPETVLEKIVGPVAARIIRLSTAVRKLQHGRLQSYILYLVLGLAALGIVAYLGRAK